ncbi:hypothetical protein BDF21DRAFT_429264 [Thamnidium elegans]|nr:hypothetical protein BDF21DRAFT_429264 [Thamnidium elegans]
MINASHLIIVAFFLGGLKQVNTFFDNVSTYYLCRYLGPLAQIHTFQPYSISTLSDLTREEACF